MLSIEKLPCKGKETTNITQEKREKNKEEIKNSCFFISSNVHELCIYKAL